jgi:hypothetical protein
MKLVGVLKMKKIALLFLCSWLISCGNDTVVPIPDNVLSKEKMAQILTDMHLLEASMNLNIANTVVTVETPDMENNVRLVLKKNAVTKEQYETSFAFYTAHTELLSEIYTEVLNDLSKLQAKVANEKTPADSTSAKVSPEGTMIPVKDKELPKKDTIKKPVKEHSKTDSIKRQRDRLNQLRSLRKKKK